MGSRYTHEQRKEIIKLHILKKDIQHVEPRNFLRKYYKLLKNAELEHLKFHAASRHTFATRLLEANEHPKVVQEMLGHASIVLTLDTYSHVLPEIKQAAAAKLNFLFQKKSPPLRQCHQLKMD